MADFVFGLLISSLFSYAVCSSYASTTEMYADWTKDIEKDVDFWTKYYNQQQREFFG
jgi:hypothetical protein